jgi:hypothetical protein
MCRCLEKYFKIIAKIILCCMILITIIQLVMGSIYLGQCPMKPQIPIYNLVAGISGISSAFLVDMFFLPILFEEACTCKCNACFMLFCV